MAASTRVEDATPVLPVGNGAPVQDPVDTKVTDGDKTEGGDSESDYEADDNRGGMKLRELQQAEYTWLKRNHWW